MMAIGIVAIVAGTIIAIIAMIQNYNEKKMKIEAALREEEMMRGYMPGTYSRSFASKKAYKELRKYNKKHPKEAFAEDFKMPGAQERMDKEDLEKAISDLEKRIANLDTIMKEKKNGKC